MSAAQLEAAALAILKSLVDTFGRQLVGAVLEAILGAAPSSLVDDVSLFVAAVLRAVTEQVDADKIRAIVDAQYAAADATVDAIENAALKP